MDYSAAEQQQYQQQQQQQYQHQQYQPEQPQSQSYDPSQHQAYYASYNNQQQYQYYPSYDYATATGASSSSYHPHQYHPESASIHPPGVPVTPDPNQSQNFENASYYPQHHQSSLSQFPGSFDAAQTSVRPPIGQSAHRGGGRKGGRLFRGGGRGHSRGRGRNGGRYGPPHSGVPNSAPLASVPGQATLTEPAQVPAAPRMAWCKICRVDCNTPEILEQHKNGKRHKKNLQTHAELQNLNKVVTEQQNVQLPNPEVQTEVFQPDKVEGSGEKQLTQESVPSQAPTDNDRNETELPNNSVDKVEVNTIDSAEDPQRKIRDQFVARGRGLKRKIRGGRGGKYMRTSEGSRRPVEPPKPKEVIPFICELCNVKCESQVVFNSHLVGKKHIANVKRFHGHRALYGEAGLQALYPPNLNASSSSVTPQVQQGVNDPQVLLAQLLTYVLAQAQTPGLLAAQVPGLAAAVAPVLASSQETQYQFNSQTQGPLVISEAENKIVTLEAEGQPESITSEPVVTASVSIDTSASLPQDNPVIASLEKPDDHAEQDLSAAITLNLSNQGNNPNNAALENKEQDPGSEPEVTASISIDTNASLPQDNPVIASLEKPDDHAEQDLSAAITLNLSNQGNNPDNAALENKEQDPGSEPEVTASVSIDTNASLPQDNPVIASLEKTDDHAEQDLSAAITLNLSNQGNNPDNAALENKEQDPGSEPEVTASVSIDTNSSLPQDNPVIASLEKPDDHAEQDLSAAITLNLSNQGNNPDNAALENKEQDPGSEPEVDPDEDSELEL